MNANIRVQFLGGLAGDNLTGSCILLTVIYKKQISKFLIDAGIIQYGFKESFKKNREILDQLRPRGLDAIILTHSHIDHVGRVPLLVKHGFGGQKGRIITTEATASLLPVMLEDSAKIQAIDSEHLKTKVVLENLKNFKDHGGKKKRSYYQTKREMIKNSDGDLDPLYDLDDVKATCTLIKNGGFPYKIWIKLAKGINLKFYPSGHVLGGAICVIGIQDKNKEIFIGFSGDLGRQDGIILPPPEMVEEELSYWVSESTYGGSTHPGRDEEISQLLKLITRASNEKKKVIIPSFALERAQEIVYLLSYYMKIGKIPVMPIYLDSPMAKKITEIFSRNWDLKMFEGQEALDFNPFSVDQNPYLKTIDDQESSLALIKEPGPYIVIAGSGMCNAGRVRDHLRSGLGQKQTIVCLVGYMAKRSLGRELKDGQPIVRMNRIEIAVKAEIAVFDSFSAHADSPFLTSYANYIASNRKLKKIFLNHGEGQGATSLKLEMLETLPKGYDWLQNIVVPKLKQEVIL